MRGLVFNEPLERKSVDTILNLSFGMLGINSALDRQATELTHSTPLSTAPATRSIAGVSHPRGAPRPTPNST